jgi:hypothetical protein
VLVEFSVQGAREMMMRTCTRCGQRTWTIDGRRVSIGEVIATLRVEKNRAA